MRNSCFEIKKRFEIRNSCFEMKKRFEVGCVQAKLNHPF